MVMLQIAKLIKSISQVDQHLSDQMIGGACLSISEAMTNQNTNHLSLF